jgi:hypothetical protein
VFDKKKQRQEMPALADSLNFFNEDLIANERLSLSERQAEMFFDKRENSSGCLVGVFGAAAIMLCAGLGLGGSGANDPAAELGRFLILVCLLLIPVALVLERERSRYNKDLDSSVKKVEGTVLLEMEVGNGYRIRMGDQAFKVKKEVYFSFKQGDPYQLFYAPGSKTILSAKPLGAAADAAHEKPAEDFDED